VDCGGICPTPCPAYCSEGCTEKKRGNGKCNAVCLTEECNYDDGDCCDNGKQDEGVVLCLMDVVVW